MTVAAGEGIRLPLEHIELAACVYGPAQGRPVIALHGWLDNAMSFARMAPKLEGMRIVALDMAGHGLSGHRPAGSLYNLWDNVFDLLAVARYLGWQRFSLLGHSLGAIVSTLAAATFPEQVERLALIDGLFPPTNDADSAPDNLAKAMRQLLSGQVKEKTVYPSRDVALRARLIAGGVSREAAELLAERGLVAVAGGYSWRSDVRLKFTSAIRLSPAQAEAFLHRVQCPVQLVLAEQGLLARSPRFQELSARLPFATQTFPGGHHLHLDDEAGARSVADCFNRFFASA
jgi:pimeloyl-ACP methyl ester carboxylesterase